MAGTTKDIRDRVIEKLQAQLQRTQAALEKANQRISELEKQLGKSPSAKFDASFSVEAEEKRQQRRGRKKKANWRIGATQILGVGTGAGLELGRGWNWGGVGTGAGLELGPRLAKPQ